MKIKRIIILMLVLAIAAGEYWRFGRPMGSEEFGSSVRIYGNVDIRQVSLAFEQNGRILELLAEEGDKVTKGQLLARTDVRMLRLQAEKVRAERSVQEENLRKLRNGYRREEIAKAEAALHAAEASLDQAERNYRRMQSMRRSNSVSLQDMENAQTSLKVSQSKQKEAAEAYALLKAGSRVEDIAIAEAQIQVTSANLAVLEHQISLGELYAPCDAVVSSRILEPGDMAFPNSPVFLLSLNSPKWVRAYLSEPQLGRVRTGSKAVVHTDSFAETVPGQVGYISPQAEFTPKSVQTEELRTSLLYEVRIMVEDPHDRLRLGMPVTVEIVTEDGLR